MRRAVERHCRQSRGGQTPDAAGRTGAERTEAPLWPLKKEIPDPRTKFALLVLIAVFCLGGAGGARFALLRVLLSVLPYALYLAKRKWRKAVPGLILLFVSDLYLYGMQSGALSSAAFGGGAAGALFLFAAGICTRLLPSLKMGSYAMETTSVSSFSAAMHRMHVPDAVSIPMSVMFRFFPTIRENGRAIREAMVMRGIGRRPLSRYLEYRLVPLVECTARSGEDLSASALMRGLGAPGRRTDICRIGFGIFDGVLAGAVVLAGILCLCAGA